MFNVKRYPVQILLVTDYMLKITWLPCERYAVPPRIFGYTHLKTAYHGCKVARLRTEDVALLRCEIVRRGVVIVHNDNAMHMVRHDDERSRLYECEMKGHVIPAFLQMLS